MVRGVLAHMAADPKLAFGTFAPLGSRLGRTGCAWTNNIGKPSRETQTSLPPRSLGWRTRSTSRTEHRDATDFSRSLQNVFILENCSNTPTDIAYKRRSESGGCAGGGEPIGGFGPFTIPHPPTPQKTSGASYSFDAPSAARRRRRRAPSARYPLVLAPRRPPHHLAPLASVIPPVCLGPRRAPLPAPPATPCPSALVVAPALPPPSLSLGARRPACRRHPLPLPAPHPPPPPLPRRRPQEWPMAVAAHGGAEEPAMPSIESLSALQLAQLQVRIAQQLQATR